MLSPAPVTFKANTLLPALHTLSGLSVLAVQGRDAAAFLQAQLMNDVAALAPGQWQWNGWLNPKGRVIALFALARAGDNDYFAVLPDFPAAELQQLLQRYVFRSKLELKAREDLACAAEFPALPAQSGPRDRIAEAPANAWALDLSGEGGARTLWLLPTDSERLAPADAATDLRWRAQDLAQGLPRLGRDQSEAWTPQMLSLDRLSAFSLKKGCYPGQEIVARTHFLGKAKRGLFRLSGSGLRPGQAVQGADGRDLGDIVCTAADEALAVLPIEAASDTLQSGGYTLQVLPLLGGLQRPV